VFLGCHALRRGYRARIYTYNLDLFDPSWFEPERADIIAKLTEQARHKPSLKLQVATRGYLAYLELGGEMRFVDLTLELIRRYLTHGRPILTGLSATYLYHDRREFGPQCVEDDIRGEPAGHFVVLCGYDRRTRHVLIADPQHPNPLSKTYLYTVSIERVLGAVLLGVLTYDANLLIIEPLEDRAGPSPTGGSIEPGTARRRTAGKDS
jgi:hypothetical protein